ncbi:MAG: HlyD family efflux transporter periplasmic adaptor subunit [Alphaproteobacteria bacterium]|nr:HlyD family efflux transporter periplasmic adaptor subunit [Alphaproteobacteria bacterium]
MGKGGSMRRECSLRKALAAAFLSAALSSFAMPATVAAHGGEEHEEAAAPSSGAPSAPRATAQSDDFELVGVAHGRTLTLYLDRFVDNVPIIDAKIEAEVRGQTLQAEPNPDGTYRIVADWIAIPGHHDIVFTVVTAERSDLLTAKLDVPEPTMAMVGPTGTLRAHLAVGGNSMINLVAAFLVGMLTMWAAMRIRPLAALTDSVELRHAALAIAKVRRSADEAMARLDARLKAFTALSRRALSDLRSSAETSRARLFQQARHASVWLATGQQVVFAAARRKVRHARSFTSLTVVSIGFVVIALVLLFVERAVFAGGPGEDPTQTSAPSANAGNGPRRQLDGTVFMPKASQRLLNLRTVVTKTSEAARTMRIAGHVIADPGTSGQVHSSIKGRIVPAGATWPRIGQQVAAGEVLAWIVPVINPIDRGIIFQQLAQIDQEIGLIQVRVQRVSAEGSTATAREVDEARADLANLSRRRAAIALVLRDRDTLRAPLLAPSDGVIAASFAVSGQLVSEQQKLFEVVDPKRLWIEAYAYDITAIGEVTAADATSSMGKGYKLKFVSRGPQLQKQTIPLYFQIEAPDATLSVGSVVTVLMQASDRRQGVILPRESVVTDTSGQSVVWQHTEAEIFVPVPVRVEPIDGTQILIIAGLKPNSRVVVESADLLNEVR